MDNLEHGWIVNSRERSDEEIGYCECCEQTLYSGDYYKQEDGFYYCEDCWRKIQEEMENEEDD